MYCSSDGYKAYASFCARNESIIHAQCWVHTRRQFFDAREQEPVFVVPSNPFTRALGYLREREAALRVFLDNPDVPLDTNHLERGLRPIPMGRKAWNFCWTELGVEHVGIIQTLISTCQLQGVDPYTYLVDVLQRVAEHPAADVIELTPRVWKTLFADDPLRSDLYDSG